MDITALRAFSVVSSELNMHRAADLLNISQPPLSRKIKNFEKSLGLRLFVRRSYGLELTPEGKEILEIVQPLLIMQENVQRTLDSFRVTGSCVVGFTTAFDQSIYEPVIDALNSLYEDKVTIKRSSSVQLANDVIKGNILAAWIALPMDIPGLSILDARYTEPLLAVIPEQWQNLGSEISLCELNNRPFFWFSACRNPYWHERMGTIFKQLGFKPKYIDEPLEYEVLLAQIAAGEGCALIPESFTAIQRKGIRFIRIHDLPPMELGIIYGNKNGKFLAQKCANCLS